jgi:hypothetical protein
VLAVGALDHAEVVREVVERGLVRERSAERSVERAGLERRHRAVVGREVAGQRVRHVVARAAQIRAAVELRLVEAVEGVGVAVRSHLVGTAPQRSLAASAVRDRRRAAVVGDEGRVLDADVLAVVGVGEVMAHVARHPVEIVVLQARSIGRRRAAVVPADRRVASADRSRRCRRSRARPRPARPRRADRDRRAPSCCPTSSRTARPPGRTVRGTSRRCRRDPSRTPPAAACRAT